MHPLIVKDVRKKFRQGDRWIQALAGISLTVEQGNFLAIMGASGSGKSTLLHLMAGLTNPDDGQVLINDTDLSKMNDRQLTLFRRHQIGLIFQAFNLIPTLSAEENLRLPLLLDGTSDEQIVAKSDSLLAQLGLLERRTHRPDALSGGEQQRIAIGRALITDPAVILADEPTGNLDSANSQSVCELLHKLCTEQHRTILMVTHEPSVAVWASEVAILKDGKLVTRFATEGIDAEALAIRYQEALKNN
ncbi:MAG TPA: ABC transporter ATP-binding protein [Tepidisphaeraceae bacterium]|nr:ABC transporter ATP-binding protein [Tepidisphaeraceae bacterium]